MHLISAEKTVPLLILEDRLLSVSVSFSSAVTLSVSRVLATVDGEGVLLWMEKESTPPDPS